MSFFSQKSQTSEQEDATQTIGTETVALAGFDKPVREKLLMAKVLAIKNVNYSYHAVVGELLDCLKISKALTKEDRGSPADLSRLLRCIPKVNGLLTNTMISALQDLDTILLKLVENRRQMQTASLMELNAPALRAILEVQEHMSTVAQGLGLMKHEPTISEALQIKNRIAVDKGVHLDETAILTAKQEQNEAIRAANAVQRLSNMTKTHKLDQAHFDPDQADKYAIDMDAKVRRITKTGN